MGTCSAVLTYESVDEILWHDHSNESFSPLSSFAWYHLFFNILQNEILAVSYKNYSYINTNLKFEMTTITIEKKRKEKERHLLH